MSQKLEATGMRGLLNNHFTLASFSETVLGPLSAHRGADQSDYLSVH